MFALTVATVIFAFILILKGAFLSLGGAKSLELAFKALYNRPAATVLWLLGLAWTLWEVAHLGVSDFGSFKVLLFVIFGVLGVASLWMLKDYLLVRAVALIVLYLSWWFLKAAYLQPQWTRLFLVVPVYLSILLAFWLTVAPWRVRDFIEWMRGKTGRVQAVAWAHIGYGILLLAVAGTYRWA